MRESSTYGRKGIEKSTSSADHTKVVRRLNKKAHKRKRNYKLALIKPTQLIDGKPLKFERSLTPTRVLPYIAALTPEEFEVSIIDDTIEEINYSMETDIVGITSLLPQVPRAIQIADNFRNRGIKVVMGGVGASSLPDEVLPHVDSLVIGEAENIWHKVLEDFKQNKLEKIYRANQLYSMNNMAIPRFELLRKEGYVKPGKAISSSELPRVPVETSRGCPHDCSFCYVSRYFG
ncbi:MAG TPA: hypothetical protein EYP78_05130, partial [Candidatus Omnitrophica bacterium]|nr:hypothetical protein [Candidatus Omnitrophota bacterium]